MNKKELLQVKLGKFLWKRDLRASSWLWRNASYWRRHLGSTKDQKNALAVLRRAVELGVNFIDTADSYGPYVNEELIAEALFPYPAGLVIATRADGIVPAPTSDARRNSCAPSRGG